MIREFSAKESLEFLEVGMGQFFSLTLRFAWAFLPLLFLFRGKSRIFFFFQAELSFRSGMREVTDVLSNYKLHKAYV